MQHVLLLWSLLDAKARRKFILLVILTTFSGFVEILSVGLIIPFVAAATNSLPFGMASRLTKFLTGWVSVMGVPQQNMPAALGLVFLLGVITANCFLCAYQFFAARVINEQRADFGKRVMHKISSRPLEVIDSTNSSDLVKLTLTEVNYVGSMVNAMAQIAAVVSRCLIVYGFFLVAQLKLALSLACGLGILYILVFRFIQRPVVAAGKEDQDCWTRMFRYANELLGGYRVVRSTATEKFFLSRFEQASDDSVLPQVIRVMPTHLTRAGLETATISAVIGLLIYFNWKDGNLANGLPILSSYAVAGIRLLPAIQQSINFMLEIKFYGPSLQNLADMLKEPSPEKMDTPLAARPPAGKIVLQDISYGFQPDIPVLKNISLEIEPASRVAFVGETGAGKSTLADLIMGLRFPQAGSLEVGGTFIDQSNARSWRRSLGYVPQTIYLLDDNLTANIAFGVEPADIDMARVIDSCRTARIWDFIQTLPEGLDTNVGERGVKLSGGQKQRIGIARALYHNPDVIVFDEATAALDTATENSILEALEGLKGSKTLVVIAHRLNTIWDSDKIFVMDNGRISAQGSSTELLQSSPIFKELASHQLTGSQNS